MKFATAGGVLLAMFLIVYEVPAFLFSTKAITDTNQCQEDMLKTVQAGKSVGNVGTISDACAGMAGTAAVGKAILK